MITKSPLQKILQGILYAEDENKHSHERMGIIKFQEKSKKVVRELDRISCMHTNPFITKTTKL
jgi:hypothetical protein